MPYISLCSKHRIRDSNCSLCNVWSQVDTIYDMGEPDGYAAEDHSMKHDRVDDCKSSRPIPIPYPVQVDTRERIVNNNLVGEKVQWTTSRWSPQWTSQWSDLWKWDYTEHSGIVRAVIESSSGLELLVERPTGRMTRVSMNRVRVTQVVEPSDLPSE